jgi:hypothetical protein
MEVNHRRLDVLRTGHGPVAEHVIDEFVAGRPSRRQFLRRGTMAVAINPITIAGQIQRLLLDETPIIYPYFYDYLSATQKNVTGVYPTAIGQLFLWNAAKT